eukprot:Plantae.Rhodophyta-Purpureofilum_apyrenoidigerum.ctg6581.p1 GENE.Plantae.Rhodophyta-Purpureofilum_apyrenoidigerum.ctg6581~~Plantae.Rhodophyta-Purpureofilum_apyrenoidigerum.ctg6581.p1  ORF type:complete len:251 (+),score=67.74 Plantae.Rhodophyta-Purpureofilum_apyrenoidigerum.ctg6581:502-1254(+)
MSSFRNAIPRREHRERGQLNARQKLGLLEKKKDYKLRARDYHQKQNRLRALKEKAAFRNPDEFYFGMVNGAAGKKASDGVAERTTEERLLASSKDMGYVYHKAAVDQAKSQRLKSSLHFLEAHEAVASVRQHTIFVEDSREQESFDAAKHLDVPRELVSRMFNRPRTSDLERAKITNSVSAAAKKLERRKAAEYQELAERLQRSERLTRLGKSIELEKQLMKNGAKRRVVPRDPWTKEPAVYKWKKQRSK